MAEMIGMRNHRLVDKMVIHVETEELGHEITYERFKEILDGYEILLGTLEDSRTYNPNDTRTQQQETADMKLSHKLYLSPAVEGSYSVEARIYDDSEDGQPTLPFEGQGFDRVFTVIECAATGDADKFAEAVPSKLGRLRVLEGVKKVSPKPSERITVTSGLKAERTTHLKQADVIPFHQLQPVEDEYTDSEVIGTIALVDFEKKTIWLRPKNAAKRFKIQYDPEIEERLIDARYKLMKVNCKVKYNLNGDIAEIIDADGIEELELRPIEIDSFVADDGTHVFRHPITVIVELDETSQVYLGVFEELDLCVYVEHQDEMRQEILDDLAWRWSAIAIADENELAPDALAVRNTFLDLVVE